MGIKARLRIFLTRWLRHLPPFWIIGILALATAGIEGSGAVIKYYEGPESDAGTGLVYIRAGLLAVFAFSAGAFRVLRLNPAYDGSYRDWLRGLPWRHPRPLPYGALAPDLYDALTLGLLTAVCLAFAALGPYIVLLPWVVAYTFFCMHAMWMFSIKGPVFALAFSLLLLFSVLDHPLTALMGFFVWLAAAYWSTGRFLKAFPWGADIGEKGLPLNYAKTPDRLTDPEGLLDWPFKELLMLPDNPRWPEALCFAGLAAAAPLAAYRVASYYFENMSGLDEIGKPLTLLVPLIGLGAAYRIRSYMKRGKDPCHWIGRLRHGRIMIPAYDQIFVTPLAALFLGWAVARLQHVWGIPVHFAAAVQLGSCTLLLLKGPPSLRSWLLAGRHRIVPYHTQSPARQRN
jgi:hypothetical protein